jgi:excisionase family DNA binding protein
MNQKEQCLISSQEAGRRLSIHASTLREWAIAGRLPFHKVGRIYKFDPADIDTFIANTRVNGPPEGDSAPIASGVPTVDDGTVIAEVRS